MRGKSNLSHALETFIFILVIVLQSRFERSIAKPKCQSEARSSAQSFLAQCRGRLNSILSCKIKFDLLKLAFCTSHCTAKQARKGHFSTQIVSAIFLDQYFDKKKNSSSFIQDFSSIQLVVVRHLLIAALNVANAEFKLFFSSRNTNKLACAVESMSMCFEVADCIYLCF